MSNKKENQLQLEAQFQYLVDDHLLTHDFSEYDSFLTDGSHQNEYNGI